MKNLHRYLMLISLLFTSTIFSQEITKKYPCDFHDSFITFDTTIISVEEMDEIIKYNPKYYSNYSHPISTLSKRMVELNHNERISFYDYDNPIFFDLVLEQLNYEKEIIKKMENFTKYSLDSLKKQYLPYMRADHWLETIKYEYLKSNDIEKLKSKYNDIDTWEAAAEILIEIQKEKNRTRRFKLVRHHFHNKINRCIRKKELNHEYVVNLWDNFIERSPIKEKKEYFDMD